MKAAASNYSDRAIVTTDPIRILTAIENKMATGPARILIDFAKSAAQPEAGFPAVRVALVTYQRDPGESHLAAAAREAGLEVFTIPERGRFDTSVLARLREVVDQYRPDILDSRNVKSHFFIRLLGLHKRYPWVAWNHGYTATSPMDRAYNQLDRWSLRAAFRAVTVCAPFSDRLVKQEVKKGNITVLGNFVKPFVRPPEDEIRSARIRLGLGEDEAVILGAGRLSHSAEDWRQLLLPEIERQQKLGKEVVFRADAAFAKPELYEALEERGVKYAIRGSPLKPLISVRAQADLGRVLSRAEEYTKGFNVEHEKTLLYVISELLYNTMEHGNRFFTRAGLYQGGPISDIAGAKQCPSIVQFTWYSNRQEMSFIAADLGVGIKKHLENVYP